jgi:hypothetical protein
MLRPVCQQRLERSPRLACGRLPYQQDQTTLINSGPQRVIEVPRDIPRQPRDLFCLVKVCLCRMHTDNDEITHLVNTRKSTVPPPQINIVAKTAPHVPMALDRLAS